MQQIPLDSVVSTSRRGLSKETRELDSNMRNMFNSRGDNTRVAIRFTIGPPRLNCDFNKFASGTAKVRDRAAKLGLKAECHKNPSGDHFDVVLSADPNAPAALKSWITGESGA